MWACVGVEKAPKHLEVEAKAIDDGAVRISTPVRLGMMAPVVAHPGQDRALEGHRAGGAKQISDPGVGLKALVRKIAVKADTGPHPDNEVADEEGDDFHSMDGMGVEPEQAAHRTGEGDADENAIVDFLSQSGPPEDNASCRPGGNASWGDDRYALLQWGDRHCARSISLKSICRSNARSSSRGGTAPEPGRRLPRSQSATYLFISYYCPILNTIPSSCHQVKT
jgi:hypothetical protein